MLIRMTIEQYNSLFKVPLKMSNSISEPLLQPNPRRFVLFPIKYPKIWEMYKKALASFWVAEEIDLEMDVKQWNTLLSVGEKQYLMTVLGFFAASDGIVNENLVMNFCSEIEIPEVRCFYMFQAAVENIHSETYSLLIDRFIKDPVLKNKTLNAVETMPCIQEKAKWALSYTDAKNAPFSTRLIAFALVEGVFFSASFCAIFWLKHNNKMPGLGFSNELISRDEGLHCDFACLLYREHVVNKLSDKDVHRITDEAVTIETTFVQEALPVSLIGMNASLMAQYVRFCADRLLVALGHTKLYNVTMPFGFMEQISINGKTNFFERRVGEYAKAGVLSNNGNISWNTDF
jgi:ribonucleoside-diphosphate reductase beta chain